jgi:hypothetical protein
MPDYATSTEAAQRRAEEIARQFTNYECVSCAKAIVQAIGPRIDASVMKLRARGAHGLILLPSKGVQAATTGHHVGVRIGGRVYDNHFPDGVPIADWPELYTDRVGGPLLRYERQVAEFFGRVFRWKEFSAFASSRFQDEDLEF